jgi:hypothetical protein
MVNSREKWMNLLMAANGLLFVGTFLGIGLFNRPSADDFHYLALVQQHGVWDAMLLHYHHWNPRWASTLVVNGFFSVWQDGVTLPVLHLMTVVVGWSAFAILFWALRKRNGIGMNRFQSVMLPLYLLAGLFHVSFGRGDTWYWLCSVPMYLWGVLATAFGFGLLFLQGGKWWRIPSVAVVFAYVGGSSEPVAVCALIVLIYVGLLRSDNVGPRIFHVATLACLIGLMVDAMGNGALVRMEHLPQLPITEKLWVGLKNYGRLLLLRIPSVLPALMAFLLPIAWIGQREAKYQAVSLTDLYVMNRHGFAMADLLLLCISFMMGLLMSDAGPDRAWLPISAMLFAVGAVVAYRSGNWLNGQLKGKLFHLALLSQVMLLAYQSYALTNGIPKARIYASAVDDRMRTIAEAVDRGDTLVVLKPLPDAGWLQSAEVTADTAHHLNQHLSLHFGKRVKLFVPEAVPSGAQ